MTPIEGKLFEEKLKEKRITQETRLRLLRYQHKELELQIFEE